ncbi:hypothetical protein D9758_017657 [Tetrapyrgos nigripes]|uniref:Ribonuclease H1 N-terminal domain-containing protein n=1 Tax=Tetrapyrgos nigripes TaxID=182062 RepID=A0A8H5C2Q5_9AGAR|nr:hypothetical protein D9758_017657 [Tetrapyrgos nigripes]
MTMAYCLRGPTFGKVDAPRQDFLWYLVTHTKEEGIYIDWELADARTKKTRGARCKGFRDVKVLLEKWQFFCKEQHTHTVQRDKFPLHCVNWFALEQRLLKLAGLLEHEDISESGSESSDDNPVLVLAPLHLSVASPQSRPPPVIDPTLLTLHAAQPSSSPISPCRHTQEISIPLASQAHTYSGSGQLHTNQINSGFACGRVPSDVVHARQKFLEAWQNGLDVQMVVTHDINEGMSLLKDDM